MTTTSITLPRQPRRWLTVLPVFLVFGSGIIIGGAGTALVVAHSVRQAIRHPEQIPAHLTVRLTRKLDLDPGQSADVERILTARLAHIGQLRAGIRPQVLAELTGMHGDIRKILNPPQQEKWDKMYDDVLDNWFPANFRGPPATQPTAD